MITRRCKLFEAAVLCGLTILGGTFSAALAVNLRVEVLNNQAPPGGVAQALINLYDPKPILVGQGRLAWSDGVLDSAVGVGLFGGTDVCGAALIQGNGLLIRTAPSTTFGTDAGPVAAVSLAVSPSATPGLQALFQLDPANSWFLDPSGNLYTQTLRSGVFQVGGTVSINNVVPGGGMIAAGTVITVYGQGFQPGAEITMDTTGLGATTFVDSTRLQVLAAQTFQITGRKIGVLNPDGSFDYYYSYYRGVPAGQSSYTLLASTMPIFSDQTFSDATVGPLASGSVRRQNFLAGLALQNPSSVPAYVSIAVYSQTASGSGSQNFLLRGVSTVTIAPGLYVLREISEFISNLPSGAGYLVRAVSPLPLQMLGLQFDSDAGSFSAVLSPAPTAPGTFAPIQ